MYFWVWSRRAIKWCSDKIDARGCGLGGELFLCAACCRVLIDAQNTYT